MDNIEKTIPYKPSAAQLESLRILRERTKSSTSIQDGEEEESMTEEINPWNSDPGPKNTIVEENIP
jgi:hypothetical protein